jgi:hypothetical protein
MNEMNIESNETVKEANKFLKSHGIGKVGSLKRYEIKPDGNGIEVTDWSVIRYYYKDGQVEENLNGCTIHISKEVRKRLGKIIGDV